MVNKDVHYSSQCGVIRLLFIDSLHYFICHTGAIDICELKATYLLTYGWLRGTVVERRSLTGELSLSCARPAADG